MISKVKSSIANWLRKRICPSSEPRLTDLQLRVYNDGERLIPGVTHNIDEVARHKSSYDFFRAIIEYDIATVPELRDKNEITIADFGFGVGHGCYLLARISKSRVTGIDISIDCLDYARTAYASDNISYVISDLSDYSKEMPQFDYVVSRGVFEHVPDGLEVALATRWRQRLLFDVPYDEPGGPNPFHLLTGIKEEHFSKFPQCELFYQDLKGEMFDASTKPITPNMIMCVCSRAGLATVNEMGMIFPIPAWRL